MFVRFLLVLIISSVYSLTALGQDIRHSSDFHQPFWRTKPEVQKRILDENLVVVSSDVTDIKDSNKLLLKIVAGGALDVPMDFAFKEMTNYEKLTEIDSHFEEAKYDSKKKVLFIKVSALGYYADMHLKLSEIPSSKDTKQVHWECIEGQFKGMKGVFEAKAIDSKKTEISMTSKYEAEKIPLPKVLMGLGLEVLGRQTAVKMRDYIKDQYKNR